MKAKLTLLCLLCSLMLPAQITQVHHFDENVNFYTGYEIDILYSYQSNATSCNLYNLDFSLYKHVNLQLPSGYGISSISYVSRGIFTNDNRISFIVNSINNNAADSQKAHTAAYDENGEMVYDFGYCQNNFGTAVWGFNNHYYALVHFGTLNLSISAYEITTDVYQLYGTPSQTTFSTPQIKQMPQLPYPNPTTGLISLPYALQQETGSLFIFNQSGKQIERKHVSNAQDYLMLDVKNYPAGQYFYTVEGQTQSFIVK